MLAIIKRVLNRGSEHFFFVGATIISAGIRFLYSVFVKAHIEPLEYGIYSTCLLLQTYMTYAQLGSLNAFNRDYPQLIGAGDKEGAKRYRDTTFSFLVIAFGITTVILSAIILIFSGTEDKRYTYGLVLCTIITTLTIFENFLASRVRIDGSFKYTSFVIIMELIAVAIGFLLISNIGYYGLYFVTIGSMVIGIILYYKKGISDLRPHIDKVLLKSIILSGIPLLVNNLIWTIVNSIDKFVILGFINTEALGIYSIAQMAFSYMILVPNAMSQLFYVRLGKVYGATESVEELNATATRYTLVISVVISFIVITVYYLMEPLVAWVMPKYINGVKAAQILMLGLAIYAPTMVNGNILTILKKNAALLRGSVYLCILNAVCSIGLVLLFGAKIENVALGTAISYLFRTIILGYQLKHNAGTDIMKMLKASVLPALLIAGPGIIIFYFFNNGFVGFGISFVIAVCISIIVYKENIMNVLRNK